MTGIDVTFQGDGCAILTMRNGENRVNPNLINELNNALDEVERHTSCKLLVTTGVGKFYSNGFDIQWYLQQNLSDVDRFLEGMRNYFWRLAHFPVPTVAAINGHAFGAGAFLALSHDYRVMRSDRGWITWNEVLHDFPIHDSLGQLLQLKLTSKAIRECVVFAKRQTAQEAYKLGIVDEVVDASLLISKAMELGQTALGNNKIKRKSLETTKMNMYPKRSTSAKL